MPPLKSITYSIPYLLVLTIFFIVYVCNKPPKKVLSDCKTHLICCGVFILFFGFRGLIGWDWYNYMPSYISHINRDIANLSNSDFGFEIYSDIIKFFTTDYQCFVFINTVIDIVVLNYILKKYSPYYALSFAVFMVVSLGTEVDTIRNMKSMEVFLLSLDSIQERKFFKYLLFILVAISLHASAILYLPFYFYGSKVFSRKSILWLIIIGNIVYLSQIQFIKPIIELFANLIGGRIERMSSLYFASEIFSSARGLSPSYIERLITSILVYAYYNKLIILKRGNILFVNLFLSYMIITLFMAEMSIIFYRVGAMFVLSYWIIWPSLIECFKYRGNRNLYITWLVIASYLLVTVRSNTILYHYDNVLFGIRNYEKRVAIRDWAAPILINGN